MWVQYTWWRQRPGLLVASSLGKTDTKEGSGALIPPSLVWKKIPRVFAFLIQSHFLVTAPLKGTKRSHPGASFSLTVVSRFCVLPIAKGIWRLESPRLYGPCSLSGHPSFLSPWTHWESRMATFPGVLLPPVGRSSFGGRPPNPPPPDVL